MMTAKRLRTNESGLVSIIVTVLVMLLISFIVMGFAAMSRREQRQSLDRQLNQQAYYAAETGINDAVKALQYNNTLSSSDCTAGKTAVSNALKLASPSGLTAPPAVDGTNIVDYSCLLIDPSPTSIVLSSLDQAGARVFPIDSGGTTIGMIEIAWQAVKPLSSGGTYSFAGCRADNSFPPINNWSTDASVCDAPVLRIDLVPVDAPTLTRDGLINSNMIFYAYPRSSVTPNSYGTIGGPTLSGASGQGAIANGSCNTSTTTLPQRCVLRVTGLSNKKYYMRVQSIYQNASIVVTPKDTAGSVDIPIYGAQALIEATGRANDVLKRIQVRVSLNPTLNVFGVKSFDALCKRLNVYTSSAEVDSFVQGKKECEIVEN